MTRSRVHSPGRSHYDSAQFAASRYPDGAATARIVTTRAGCVQPECCSAAVKWQRQTKVIPPRSALILWYSGVVAAVQSLSPPTDVRPLHSLDSTPDSTGPHPLDGNRQGWQLAQRHRHSRHTQDAKGQEDGQDGIVESVHKLGQELDEDADVDER